MSEEAETPMSEDIVALRRRVADLEQQLSELAQREAALQDEIWIRQSVLDAIPHAIYWKDSNLVYGGCNQCFANDMGIATTGEIVGKTDKELPWQPGEAEVFQAVDRRVMADGVPVTDIDETVVYADGTQEWFEAHKAPLHDQAGQVVGVLATYTNITRRKRAEETIQAQTVMLHELSTPVIPFSEEVLVMPLIGSIDTRRAQQALETLLSSIATSRARIAILDITGVPVVDTQVANALLRAAQAVSLLGAQVVLTGIRPEVAQTIVGLGVSLEGVVTRSSLRSGIAYAMGSQSAQI
jgi:rsbT co-antagonist protein RsbR